MTNAFHFPIPTTRRRALAATVALVLATPAYAYAGQWMPPAPTDRDGRPADVAGTPAEQRLAARASHGKQGPSPRGTTIPVSSCADDGSGSLRAAVASAVSGDTIDASGLACTISLASGIAIGVDDLRIVGAGPRALTVGNGAKYGRVFTHTGTGTLDLRGMTITSGVVSPNSPEADSRGGCVFSAGSVALGDLFDPANASEGVVVTDCTAVSTQANVVADGGGVYAQDGLSLASSVVSGCRAAAQDAATRSNGGGVAAHGSSFTMKYSEVRDNRATGPTAVSGGVAAPFVGSVVVSHSTIAGNDAQGRAGGAYLGTDTGGTVVIDNSTISGNTSDGEAGMIINTLANNTPGQIRIASSTFTANVSAGFTGGLFARGPIRLDSSIFAANTGTDLNISSAATGADNIVGVSVGTPPSAGLITTSDPGLGPLAGHRGPTRTHALLEGSPAIDAGNNSYGSVTDQRGYERSVGASPDVGAYERDPDSIFFTGFE